MKTSAIVLAALLCAGSLAVAAHAYQPNLPATLPVAATADEATAAFQASSDGQRSLCQSGAFTAMEGQQLVLTVTSSITGGTADVFLTAPGPEFTQQRISLGAADQTVTIPLYAGTWAYNCTGFFTDGSISIAATVQQGE